MARAQPRHDRACTTIRRDTAQRSLTGGLASGVCRDTILYIVTGGAGLASRHSVPGAAIWHSAPCDTQGRNRGACATRALCRDTIFVSQAGGCDTASVRAATRQGALTTRPGRGATTRPSTHHDTALCAQPRRSGREAWVRVCTWCTQPSFDSVHCSESLFGGTDHEHYSRGFQKKKKFK